MIKLLTSLFSGVIFLAVGHSSAENIAPQSVKTLQLIAAAVAQTQERITYNGAYFKMGYPMGDVPAHYGVCTDVIIRAYRKLGIDLQQLVHEDMRSNFALYPAKKIGGRLKLIPISIIAACPICKLFLLVTAKNLASQVNRKTIKQVTWSPGCYQGTCHILEL